MFDSRAVSTYGVLFVLVVAIAGAVAAAGAVTTGSSGPADATTSLVDDRTQCQSVDLRAGGASVGSSASEHSRESYPAAPHMDVARGDIAAIETNIPRGQTGTVRIESVDGEFNVSLSFANNDGRKPATLYLNTYLAGNESAVADLAYTAGDNDRVAVSDRVAVDGAPLAVGAYDVTIETESGTRTKRVTVDDPAVGDLTLERAPGDRFDELATDEAILEARSSGLVSEPTMTNDGPRAALGDTMVYRLNASGLYGLLAAQGGAHSESNFLAITDGAEPILDLDVRAAASCNAVVDVPASVEGGSMQVIPDPNNETLYVTADLREVDRTKGAATEFVGNGRAEYTVRGDTHITDSNVTTALDYTVVDRTYAYDSDEGILRRTNSSDQPVSGETSLAPGTRLTLEASAVGHDFETATETTVADDGTFETDLNLSQAPETARLTLSIAQISDSHTLLTTGNAPETMVWFVEDRTTSDSVTRIDTARVALEDGGFVAVYQVPPDEQVTSQDLIGRSDYLEAGVQDPDIRLDRPLDNSDNVVLVAHRDEDGDGRFDYPADDSPYLIKRDLVYAAGRVVIEDGGTEPPRNPRYLNVNLPPADEVTGTPAPTRTPTATPGATDTPTETPDDEPVSTTELPPPTLRETDTPTPGPTESPTAGETTVSTTAGNATAGNGTMTNGTAADGDGSTEGLGSGFGPVAVLAALLLLSAMALRRRT